MATSARLEDKLIFQTGLDSLRAPNDLNSSANTRVAVCYGIAGGGVETGVALWAIGVLLRPCSTPFQATSSRPFD